MTKHVLITLDPVQMARKQRTKYTHQEIYELGLVEAECRIRDRVDGQRTDKYKSKQEGK